MMSTARHGLTAALLTAFIAGCAATSPVPSSSPGADSSGTKSPSARKINRNLSGYSVAFRQGYVEGCDSAGGARYRDEGRYKTDIDYTMGWNDGFSICRR